MISSTDLDSRNEIVTNGKQILSDFKLIENLYMILILKKRTYSKIPSSHSLELATF